MCKNIINYLFFTTFNKNCKFIYFPFFKIINVNKVYIDLEKWSIIKSFIVLGFCEKLIIK